VKLSLNLMMFVATVLLLGMLNGCTAYSASSRDTNQNAYKGGPPAITAQPASVTESVGQAATFTVTASGKAPLSYQWYKNGAAVGTNSSTYTTPPTIAADNQSQIQVTVSNRAGVATSNPATLTVTSATVAPTITSQPVSETVTAGQVATFAVVASGTAPLNYQWYKNGAAVGANSSTYATPPTVAADNQSQIYIKISNTVGSTTSNVAMLTVTSATVAPTITSQPMSETVNVGQSATFTVTTAGTAPLTYQWYKNGAAAGTNSSTYTTSPTVAGDNRAQIQIKISNAVGNVTSNTATLTVTTTVAPPPMAISISPGTAIQSIVDTSPTGTTFVLQPGIFRMQSVTPKDNETFVGLVGAIVNGSQLATTFSQESNGGVTYWVTSGPSQPGILNGTCDTTHPMCQYPEDFFINNQPLQRVGSLAAVTPGTCYFDYSAAKVYFLDDPTGKTVEIGATTHAFSGGATNVTIKGLTIEKYASPAQDGPITGSGWTIESNEIRLNHGGGIHLNSNQVIESNYIHHNGQEGLTGTGSNVLIQNNEIAFNNTLGFNFGWEAGGTKFSNMTNLTVQGNYVHDNKGPGLALDYQCYNWTIQGNRTSGNYVAGILDEISYDGVARYNIVENDATYPGKLNPSMWWACGINIDASPNAQVYGNTLINNSNGICLISNSRGSGNRGAFEVQNLSAHDNVIVQSTGSASGAVANSGIYMGVYSSWNNHWTSNAYKLSNPLAYTWLGGSSYVSMDSTQWQSFGQDTNGTWIAPTDPTLPSSKFTANQNVTAASSTQVWSLPTTTSTLVTTEPSGAQGTITKVAGPIRTSGVWWWSVRYSDGNKGWSLEANLQ
jgi:hypothetical protein